MALQMKLNPLKSNSEVPLNLTSERLREIALEKQVKFQSPTKTKLSSNSKLNHIGNSASSSLASIDLKSST
jgi:hypothetical protein